VLKGEVVRFESPAGVLRPSHGLEPAFDPPAGAHFNGIHEGTYFYFVHSYYVVPHDPRIVATETDYPQPFCSTVWRGNLFATQYHPEKSQSNGLRMLKNFAELP